jgi:hypothetical protein
MTAHAAEPTAGPSGSGTVVLELGPGVGALILHAPPHLNGAEIEISPADQRRRTHSMVRPRHVTGGTVYAAVYPDLTPNTYTIWNDNTPVAAVTITAGIVATATWPGD